MELWKKELQPPLTRNLYLPPIDLLTFRENVYVTSCRNGYRPLFLLTVVPIEEGNSTTEPSLQEKRL